MTVAVPSTPASYFHLLRRHAQHRPYKPLVVISPKQLLRLKAASSSIEDFTEGSFQPVIGDRSGVTPAQVVRVVFVSGRLYYDLEAERAKRGDTKTAIVSVEQLYPCLRQRSRRSWICTRTPPILYGRRMSPLTRVSGRLWL